MNKWLKCISGKKLLQAMFFNLLIMIGLMTFFLPQYTNTADLFMQSLVSQMAGSRVSHLLFSNIVLGKIYTILYRVLPAISWYSVVQIAASFAAITAVAYLILLRNASTAGKGLALLMILALGMECYVFLGYTKSAAVLACSGLLLLSTAAEEKKILRGLLGMVFLTGASLFSFKVFTIVFFFGSLFSMLYLFRKKHLVPLVLLVISLAMTAVTGAGGFLLDRHMYQSEKWKAAWKYRNIYERMYTFGVKDRAYNDTTSDAKYQNLIDGYAINMSNKGYDKLKKMVMGTRKVSPATILSFTRNVPRSLFTDGFFYAVLLAALLLGYVKQEKCRIPLLIAFAGHWITLYVMYLYYNQYYLIGLMPTLLWILLQCKDLELKFTRQMVVYLAILSVILYMKNEKDLISETNHNDPMTMLIATKETESKKEEADKYCLVLLTQAVAEHNIFRNYSYNLAEEADVVPEGIYGLIPEMKSLNQNEASQKISANKDLAYWGLKKGPKITDIYFG